MDLRGVARRLRAETELWSGRTSRGCAALDGTRCAVLMYHRVLPREVAEARRVEPGMFVTPDTFGRHLDWLLGSGFRVLPLAEIVEALEGSRPLPPRACAITSTTAGATTPSTPSPRSRSAICRRRSSW